MTKPTSKWKFVNNHEEKDLKNISTKRFDLQVQNEEKNRLLAAKNVVLEKNHENKRKDE